MIRLDPHLCTAGDGLPCEEIASDLLNAIQYIIADLGENYQAKLNALQGDCQPQHSGVYYNRTLQDLRASSPWQTSSSNREDESDMQAG